MAAWFEDDSQDQRGAEQILQIEDAVYCTVHR